MIDLTHLEDHEENAPKDQLDRITDLARLMMDLEEELKQADATAKEAKKRFNKVSMELLPEAMMTAGLNNFELDNGATVSYKEELSASVKDYNKLSVFLQDHGDDALLKTSFNVEKLPQNIVNSIMRDFASKYGIDAEIKTFIHPQALKAYLSRMIGLKKGSKAKITIGDIDQEMCSTFTFYKSKVKQLKK
jgi:hypothetical protein